MTKLSFYEDFQRRVNYAAQCIRGGIKTRRRDDCYEMHDGDLVVVALMRRARNNPELMKAIIDDWRGAVPQDWLDLEAQYQSTPTRDLKVLAKEMRDKAVAEFREKMKTWETAK